MDSSLHRGENWNTKGSLGAVLYYQIIFFSYFCFLPHSSYEGRHSLFPVGIADTCGWTAKDIALEFRKILLRTRAHPIPAFVSIVVQVNVANNRMSKLMSVVHLGACAEEYKPCEARAEVIRSTCAHGQG